MAANPQKTKMINLAIGKLHGATDTGTVYIADLDDSVFATPSTGASEDAINACRLYPECLKQALRDIQPKFARRYADLGANIKITEGGSAGTIFYRGEWLYIFQLPSNFLDLIAQINEANNTIISKSRVLTAHSWSHLVIGTDSKTYYCKANGSGVAANKPITGGTWSTYFALFNADDAYGVDWEDNKAYLAASELKLLLSNNYSNANGDGAFIEYVAYLATGVGDKPDHYDEHFIQAFTTLLASEMAPWSTEKQRRFELRQEYERLAKPQAVAFDVRPDYEETETSWLDARKL